MPIPLIILGAILLFIALLLALRVRVCIALQDDISVTLHVLCFKKRLFPRQKKVKPLSRRRAKKSARKKAKQAAKEAAKAAKSKKHLLSSKKKRTLAEKIVLVRAIAAALIRKTHKHLRLHAARLHVRVATGDAAQTAVLYGVVCQSLSYLLALFDRVTKLKAVTPDVSVTADYLAEKPCADVNLVFSLRAWGALAIAIGAAIAFIRTKIKRSNYKKQENRTVAKAAGAKAQKGNRHG